MGLSHVAHDCRIGDGVIVINYAGITGHCEIGDARRSAGSAHGAVSRAWAPTLRGRDGEAHGRRAALPPGEGQPRHRAAHQRIGLRRAGMNPEEPAQPSDSFRNPLPQRLARA